MIERSQLVELLHVIIANDLAQLQKILTESPRFASGSLSKGATRQEPAEYFIDELKHYLYAGDTALHVAAMAYKFDAIDLLIQLGGCIDARNRRGAQAVHYACDGNPNFDFWDADAQYKTVCRLIQFGADPNSLDRSGVSPLHRAVRNRCTGAVRALIENGADVDLRNKSGSSALQLALSNTGKSGSGTEICKQQQNIIVELLELAGAKY